MYYAGISFLTKLFKHEIFVLIFFLKISIFVAKKKKRKQMIL